ncbi:hypothetical protein Tco_1083925 [Tanacetum coccineum]
MPLSDHAAHWANLLGEIVREFLMHYCSWHNILAEKKEEVLGKIRMQSSDTQAYPSLIQTYFDTHTVDGVFLWDEERLLYEEILRLQCLGSNTLTGVPYTDDEIMTIICGGKQRGLILDVGLDLARQGMDVIILPEPQCTHTADVDELKKTNKQLKKQIDMIMKPEIGSGIGSGGAGDDEPGDDKDADEDEEDEDS